MHPDCPHFFLVAACLGIAWLVVVVTICHWCFHRRKHKQQEEEKPKKKSKKGGKKHKKYEDSDDEEVRGCVGCFCLSNLVIVLQQRRRRQPPCVLAPDCLRHDFLAHTTLPLILLLKTHRRTMTGPSTMQALRWCSQAHFTLSTASMPQRTTRACTKQSRCVGPGATCD